MAFTFSLKGDELESHKYTEGQLCSTACVALQFYFALENICGGQINMAGSTIVFF